MPYIYIDIISAVMDIIILKLYLDISLKNRKVKSQVLYYCSFIISESILFINMQFNQANHSLFRTLFTVILSVVTTYLLCLLYDASTSIRLFAMFSFQLIAIFSEMSANACLLHITDRLYDEEYTSADVMITFVSKIIMLILTTLSSLFWKKNNSRYNYKLLGIQLVIPVLSLVLSVTFPFEILSNSKSTFYLTFFSSCLFLIGIYSFWIFEKMIQNEYLRHQSIIGEQQLAYQKKKYSQLSSAYKDTRKLIHDTKNHFFYLESCIKKDEIQSILPYLKTAISSLESGYITVNTGNLVIDSLVSNLLNIGKNENITIDTEISIDSSRLKIEDYDMCVILGNLIDNAVNAVMKIPDRKLRNIYIGIKTDSSHFSINIVNNYIPEKSKRSLEHGYGCNNVDEVTLKYKGIYISDSDEKVYTSTVIIPLCLMN